MPPLGARCCVCDDEKDGIVAIVYQVGSTLYKHNVPFYHLELVTPVEEQEPYFVTEGDKINEWDLCKQINENSCCIVATFTENHPNTKAAAEAERDRLNAEHRKEQK